jgi:Domain of unknown function (DUF4347)
MARILSIIAAPPVGVPDVSSDGSQAIANIFNNMNASIEKAKEFGHELLIERAAYVSDIADALEKHRTPEPEIIQIIGHGSSGKLQLGQYWSKKMYDPKGGYAVLDSNPACYAVLMNWIPKNSRLLLLGCKVGSDAPTGSAANGRALMFDLEQMSSANVYASDKYVTDLSFAEGFLYSGSLVNSNGKPANPTALTGDSPMTKTPKIGTEKDVETIVLQYLVSAPIFGLPDDSLKREIPPGVKNSLVGEYVKIRSEEVGKLLAMTELEFETEDGKIAQVICGFRYVRIAEANSTSYYESKRYVGGDTSGSNNVIPQGMNNIVDSARRRSNEIADF